MPQPTIPLVPSGIYHIYNHANGKDNLFNSPENYNYFLRRYTKYIFPIADTYAYCLMPNHLYLMIFFHEEKSLTKYFLQKKNNAIISEIVAEEVNLDLSALLSRQFSNLFNSYTKSINKRFRRMGSLFIPNFKRNPVEDEAYFTRLIAYIHNNPVNHRFVKEVYQWPYSSWHSYLSNKPTRIMREEGLKWFGGKEEFLKFHEEILNEREFIDL